MERKKFLKIVGISAWTLTVGGGGFSALFHHKTSHRALAIRNLKFSNLAEVRKELESLQNGVNLQINGTWDLYQNLVHCAQSIELSLTGYPEHKSAFFKNTLGSFAFSRFEQQGFMAHNINEPIPAAPAVPPSANIAFAFARLQKSLDDFENFTGSLSPHFAYGKLSKAEYTKAHAMHLADHFSAITYA